MDEKGFAYEREGGLVLCVCGHPLGYHPRRYEWFFHKGSSDAAKAAPLLPPQCSFCDCKDPKKGEFQGFTCVIDEHSLKGL